MAKLIECDICGEQVSDGDRDGFMYRLSITDEVTHRSKFSTWPIDICVHCANYIWSLRYNQDDKKTKVADCAPTNEGGTNDNK